MIFKSKTGSRIQSFKSQDLKLSISERNSYRNHQSSLKLHKDGKIKKRTINSNVELVPQSVNPPETPLKTNFGFDLNPVSKEDNLSETEIETIIARLIEMGEDAIYLGPSQDSTGCRTIPRLTPTTFRGEEALALMKETLAKIC